MMVAGYSSDATLPSHRNRGAQPALIAARATAAADSGCRWVVAQTAKPDAGTVNPSTNNMIGAGLPVLYARPLVALGLACGPDNHMVTKDGGWTTSINGRGDVEWTPPPHLDTGQARVNHYRHPNDSSAHPTTKTPAMNTTPPNQTPTHHNRTPPNTQASMPRAAIWPRSSTHH